MTIIIIYWIILFIILKNSIGYINYALAFESTVIDFLKL